MHYGLIIGYISLAVAQMAIGANVIIGKYVLDVMPVYLFLGLRFFISAVGITIACAFTTRRWVTPYHPEQRVTGSDWMMMITQGLFAGFLFNFLFLWGLEYTTAMSGGIIGSAVPAIITLTAVIILKEKLNLSQAMAVLLAIVGIVVIGLNNPEQVEGNQFGSFWGDFLIFLAMFPEAWFSILGKKLAPRIRPMAAAMVANWAAFFSFAPLMFYQSWGISIDLSGFEWMLIVLGGLLSLLFFWLWPLGLKYVSASKASLFGGFMPISTCFLAIVCLGERFHWLEGVGMIVIFASLWLGSAKGELWVESVVHKARRVRAWIM